jgi:hypothetical protein
VKRPCIDTWTDTEPEVGLVPSRLWFATGDGKSLVADILMLKSVIKNPEEKALLVLPYVSLLQERLRWLRMVVTGIIKNVPPGLPGQRPSVWRKRGDEDSIRVVGFFGGSKSKGTWADMDIAVCTIEMWVHREES